MKYKVDGLGELPPITGASVPELEGVMRHGLLRAAGVAAVVLSVLALGIIRGAAPAHAAPCPAEEFALWSEGQLRGANVFMGRNPEGGPGGFGDGEFAQADFDDLARAGANYVQISHAGLFEEQPPYALDEAAQANLDRVIEMAANAGLKAVIAFRSGPGRNENAITDPDGDVNTAIWHEQEAQDAWVGMLRYTAKRYGDNPTVVGFDPMVEPNAVHHHGYPSPEEFYAAHGGTTEDFNVLALRITAAIREVDDSTPILLEPEGWGGIDWLDYLQITGDPRTVYTVHDYTPHEYTHEDRPGSYPGNFDADGDGQDEFVDRAYLENHLETVRAFSQQHGVPVAVTEFGVHRTAGNAAGYLSDRIEIQDGIGSWAVWTWQPAGFNDPFSMHDPSAAHDVLEAAWARNCARPMGDEALCDEIDAINADVPATLLTEDEAEEAVFCLTNSERAAEGLDPLQRKNELVAAAGGHAEDAVRIKWWEPGADSHTNPETGSTPADRIMAAGYCPDPIYWRVGENTFWGYGDTAPTPRDAVLWWMNSPGHRANILDPDFAELGIGVVLGAPVPEDPANAAVFVQNFGLCI